MEFAIAGRATPSAPGFDSADKTFDRDDGFRRALRRHDDRGAHADAGAWPGVCTSIIREIDIGVTILDSNLCQFVEERKDARADPIEKDDEARAATLSRREGRDLEKRRQNMRSIGMAVANHGEVSIHPLQRQRMDLYDGIQAVASGIADDDRSIPIDRTTMLRDRRIRHGRAETRAAKLAIQGEIEF